VALTSGYTNPFAGEGATLDAEDASTSSGFSSGKGASLSCADVSTTFGSDEVTPDDAIDVSSRDEEDV
jgi:hypothetical protein